MGHGYITSGKFDFTGNDEVYPGRRMDQNQILAHYTTPAFAQVKLPSHPNFRIENLPLDYDTNPSVQEIMLAQYEQLVKPTFRQNEWIPWGVSERDMWQNARLYGTVGGRMFGTDNAIYS
jgi:hypothetical protein